MASKILEGLKVVELSTHVAVPYCGRELADMGAKVIKVEPPSGDYYRFPLGMMMKLPSAPDRNWLFEPFNMNKKQVSIDLKTELGRQALIDLIKEADVFLTNVREDKLEGINLGIEMLHEEFPNKVFGLVNGFGTDGPRKKDAGYDSTAFWGETGPLIEWGIKGESIHKPTYSYADTICAGQLTVGILAALLHSANTGEGEIVRCSLLAAGMWTNVNGLLRYQTDQEFPEDFYKPMLPFERYFKTKDGKFVQLTAARWDARNSEWHDFLQSPEDIRNDPRYQSLREMAKRDFIPEQVKYFEERISHMDVAYIKEGMHKLDEPYTILKEPKDVLDNDDAWMNGFLVKHKVLDGSEVVIPSTPVRFASEGNFEFDYSKPVGFLGSDTEEVFNELYGDAKTAKLIAEGALVVKDPHVK